jgi:hypothetical protein
MTDEPTDPGRTGDHPLALPRTMMRTTDFSYECNTEIRGLPERLQINSRRQSDGEFEMKPPAAQF